jgi:AhpD family alkylhydroperoxidase
MSTVPRIPAELVQGFFLLAEGGDTPAAQIAIPAELSRLAAIPIRTRRSLQIDPVLHELIRLYNAKYQDCEYCQNARQAVAVQHGLQEDMVDSLGRFEESDLPESYKAALRITSNLATNPAMLDDDVWAAAREHFTEQEVIDIVLLSMFTTASKTTITLGLDPGKEASSRQFFPTEDVYGESPELREAIAELEERGIAVRAGSAPVTAPAAARS